MSESNSSAPGSATPGGELQQISPGAWPTANGGQMENPIPAPTVLAADSDPHPLLPSEGAPQLAYQKFFHRPSPLTMPWRDVLDLFCHLGDVTVRFNGRLTVSRNGHTLVLSSPQIDELAEEAQLVRLRHFLEQSESPATDPRSADFSAMNRD